MIRNVHERSIPADAEAAGVLLDGLGRPGDRLWPSQFRYPMVLDAPLGVGADGGHGPIRYHVVEYEPGRRARFAFHRGVGIEGFHELEIQALPGGRCRMRHVLMGRTRGRMRLLFPVLVEPLHDAVIEDLFDNAERELTGGVRCLARHPAWVRHWSRKERRR